MNNFICTISKFNQSTNHNDPNHPVKKLIPTRAHTFATVLLHKEDREKMHPKDVKILNIFVRIRSVQD
jgi:hypothetical protein